MKQQHPLLDTAAECARQYLDSVGNRPVHATSSSGDLRRLLATPLTDAGDDPLDQETSDQREPHAYTHEESRRVRAVPVYAALRVLGRNGLRELVERCCELARRMADRLAAHPNISVLNDAVLNQVPVRVDGASPEESDALTAAAITRIQADGTCWLGGTTWLGATAMRISVSNWSTTTDDIDRSAQAILAAVDVATGKR